MRIGVNTGEVLVGALRAGGRLHRDGRRREHARAACRPQPSPARCSSAPTTVRGDARGGASTPPSGRSRARAARSPSRCGSPRPLCSRPGRRPNRGRAPLVGRDAELGLMRHAVGSAVSRRRAHLLLLIGEAGMGKTRLAEEAATAAECGHDALRARRSLRSVRRGQRVVARRRGAATQAVASTADDSSEVALERCTEAVRGGARARTGGRSRHASPNGLLHLMGYDGPLTRHRSHPRPRRDGPVALHVRRVRRPRQRPMIVLLSDLHWADDIVLERIDELLERVANQPVRAHRHRPAFAARPMEPEAGPPQRRRPQPRPARPRRGRRRCSARWSKASCRLTSATSLLDRSGGNPFYPRGAGLAARRGGDGGRRPRLDRTDASCPTRCAGSSRRGSTASRPTSGARSTTPPCIGRRGPTEALRIMAREAHGVDDIDVGDRWPDHEGRARRRARRLVVPIRPRARGRVRHAHEGRPRAPPRRHRKVDGGALQGGRRRRRRPHRASLRGCRRARRRDRFGEPLCGSGTHGEPRCGRPRRAGDRVARARPRPGRGR